MLRSAGEVAGGEPPNGSRNGFALLRCELREHGQGKHLVCCLLGVREITGLVAEIGVSGQQVDRERIMNACLDALCGERVLPGLPMFRPNGIDVIDVSLVRLRMRDSDTGAAQPAVVQSCRLPAGLGPSFEMS